MRSLPDDIPCNLVLVREPEQDTVLRNERLPSYREMMQKEREKEIRRGIIAAKAQLQREGISFGSVIPKEVRFEGNNDPHITEADCRKRRVDVAATMAPRHVTLKQGATYRFSLPQSNVMYTLVGPGRGVVTHASSEYVEARFDSFPQLEKKAMPSDPAKAGRIRKASGV